MLAEAPAIHLSCVSAQTADTIRYVRVGGSYQGSGLTWAEAKDNLQDAINDLYQFLKNSDIYSSGSIYVGAGTYKPTESTESYGGGLQYTAFKVYPGIHIYGGFRENENDMNARPYDENGNIDTQYRPLIDTLLSLESGQSAKLQPWNFVNKTILSGSHNSEPSFTYDADHGIFTTIFPGNSYHVVWFATEGFIPVTVSGDQPDHALPLSEPASVDGCTITGGYASNRTTNERVHSAYGGGAYLVANSSLINCYIYNCEATMRGGGVYLDGGGLVDKCMIHTCQASGIGIMQGYGGGVCIDYEGAVTRSYIVNNTSRIGGGVAICHAPTDYPWQSLDKWRTDNGQAARGEINVYSPHATACIITNNTTTAEGGGIFFYDGGVGNHLTITRNNCIGQDVTYNSRRHGRSGGIYILNGGQVYNSVVWGNKCAANNDIQYATYIGGSTDDVKDKDGNITKEGLNPKFYYSAIEKHDITDWAGSSKRSVMSLESSNTNTLGNDANYPYFIGSDGYGRLMGYMGAGLNTALPMGTYDEDYANGLVSVPDPEKTGIPRPIYWKPAAISSMAKMGLQVSDALHLSSQWVLHAHTSTDLFGDRYEPMSTFGALVRREEQFGCVMIRNQEIAQYTDKGYTQSALAAYNNAVVADAHNKEIVLGVHLPDDGSEVTLPTIFVDPARNAGHDHISIGEQNIGATWDKPVGTINDAIHYFRGCLKRIGSINGTDTTFVYDRVSPVWYDSNGDCLYRIIIGTDTTYHKHVQVLVKGFTRGSGINATTAGVDAYLGTQLRTAAIRPTSNMRIYGGFYADATGTDTSKRSPHDNPTVVSANITKSGYENNSAHVLALINVRNVIVDGLRLFDGNANLFGNHSYAPIDSLTGEPEPITFGGGLIINNASVTSEERIDMTGNILRNSYIANCSAPDGAAVYVNSNNKKANGEYSRAELNMLNCVIRNNTVGNGTDTIRVPGVGNAGVITIRGGKAIVRMDHCDIINNTGFAIETLEYTDNTTSVSGEDKVNENEGKAIIYNSVIYANGKVDRANRSKIEWPLSCRSASNSQNNVDGDYIYLDWDAPKPKTPAHCFPVLCRDFSDQYQKWGIRKIDQYQQTIYEEGVSPQFFADSASANQYIAAHPATGSTSWAKAIGSDDAGAVLLDYPYFDNPSRNVGHSEDGDKPMNGGVVSYVPGNQNPMVNGACDESYLLWDINGNARTRGGDPDIGAIEGTHLPEKGTVLYVTPEGAGRRDGSSWRNAIAGNTVYVLNNIAGPALAAGDKLDLDASDNPISDRILDSEGNPILTSNPKYSGGFAKIYLSASTGNPQTTTTTKTWTTETNVYDDGPREGETETLQDNVLSENTVTTGSAGGATEGFVAGWYDDDRYPYGELSGASRSFWRANPWHTSTNWTVSGYNESSFIDSCKTKGWINNSRAERYVGGLQYAVEKASTYNTLAADSPNRVEGIDSVQVWVGNGKYSDYKGFVMRDTTTVLGGFPASTIGSPGLSERQALMSDVVNIPKSLAAQNLDPKDYETILQISDTDPKTDNTTLNTAAVNYWDDDYSRSLFVTTTNYEYKKHTIEHHYKYNSTETTNDVTSTYLQYADMKNGSSNVIGSNTNTTIDGTIYYTFGTATSTQDCWHMSRPSKTNYVANIEAVSKSRNIYDPNTNTQLTGADATYNGQWAFINNGSLTDLKFWQTIRNLPAGKYILSVDMAGGYRNKFSSKDSTNMRFHIFGADGTTDLITPIQLKTIGSTTNSDDRDANRNMAYRYTLQFTQPATGDITIKLVVEDGVRNTTANNATYGTADGGDPDPIPSAYTSSYGGSNPNRREFWMSNLKLYAIVEENAYTLDSIDDQTTTNNDVEHESPTREDYTTYTSTNHRTTIRKRVLSMPDICVPTFGSGIIGDPAANTGFSYNGDNISHTDRVFGSSKDKRTSTTRTKHEDTHYVEYSNVYWDGFTIRHGFIIDERMAHGGGAGVNIYEGAHLQNCIVINNMSSCSGVKGGGVFCDGATSSIEGCFVLNNTSTKGKTVTQNQVFAGGMFMYEGTCFNSLFANNYSWGSAGGVGFCVGRFYNNTIAYNTCNLTESSAYSGGAISIATQSNPNLFVANSIIYGNNGRAIRERSDINNYSLINPFINCYIQTEAALNQDMYKKNIINWTESVKTNYGIGNILLNGEAPSAATTPFAADFDEHGNYVEGRAASLNDFRLNSNFGECINRGTENFASNLYQALTYKDKSDSEIRDAYIYQSVSQAQLPSNDVVFAERVMDCQIDMGAYEYDGTREIHPGFELIAFDPEQPELRELCAVYYVAEIGEGLGSADSPTNAACPLKLQKVLDAAGRLKLDLDNIKQNNGELPDTTYSTSNVQLTGAIKATYEQIYLDGTTKKVRQVSVDTTMLNIQHVIVKLSEGTFYPVRSTNNKMATGVSEEVLPTRSIAVPHGVEIWGGYANDNADGTYDFYETYRDPLNHKTTLSGQVVNVKNNEKGQAYHVVSFTNDVFDIHDALQAESILRGLTDRSIIDGVSIEDGYANGTEDEDRQGAAAVVNAYAHIRNCIVQNNYASKYGGGLFIMPASLVSGTVILNNEAEMGGGIYSLEPTEDEYAFYASNDSLRNLAYARVYNTTIVRNTASVRGGGLWYENNIRAKGVVLWQNTSSDMNNVSGVFDTEKELLENNYPFSYSAVQARRLPGVNNIELHTENDKDARFSQNSIGDMRWRGDKAFYTAEDNKEAYYYIEKLSALVRAGMPYNLYLSLRRSYPSLELRDMAGVARMRELYNEEDGNIEYLKHLTLTPEKKDNNFIEIGARALNSSMAATLDRPFTRIYVANPEFVDNSIATRLLESGDPLYSQPGSSMANPFQKFADALDYIIALRSNEQLRDVYRDTRFEILIAGGNYYPIHNARGEEGHARASTFLLPEGVSVIGGLDPKVFYCQEGYNFPFLQPMAGNKLLSLGTGSQTNARHTIYDKEGNDITTTEMSDVELIPSSTDDIWTNRPKEDINGNNIYEPWEFLYTTTFSGETPRGTENTDNVYHIFTCYADSAHLGALPRRYSNYYPNGISSEGEEQYIRFKDEDLLDVRSGGTEHSYSEIHRMIIFNGVNIINGNARDYEVGATLNTRNFYRGGGIFIDGNWENGELDSGQTIDQKTGEIVDIDGYTGDPDAPGLRNIPVIIFGSQFLDNQAVQGGAIFTNGNINIFSSSFAQNLTMGPDEISDKALGTVKYTGGGAIAVNGELRCTNTIFANNESQLGDWNYRLDDTAPGYLKQAFGGAIWGGKYSNVRLSNCDLVNNKGVSYPAVYVDHFNDLKKFSVNTIYWGNRASGSEDEAVTFTNGWAAIKDQMDINRDVYSYRTQVDKERTLALIAKQQDGTITPTEETELYELESHQIMYFCSYRNTFGPTPQLTQGKVHVDPASPTYGIYAQAFGITEPTDFAPQELPFMGESVNYYELFQGNNNIQITFENDGIDGPNFVLPSSSAGAQGYNPSANWMPSRINNLTDNGWSYLTLTSKTASGDTEFKKIGGNDDDNTGGVYPWETNSLPDNVLGGGPYNFYSYYLHLLYGLTFMPLGEQFYMSFRNSRMTETADERNNMLRISSNPILFNDEEKAYIDLGVYEYQHRSLRINQTSEIDVIWVSETEDHEKGNDGYSWETPTSNLQAAIETLLRSRNGHAKQVNIIGGDYKPNALLGNGDDMSMSFTIQTRLMNNGALTPTTGEEFGVKSLTIKGGYDPIIPGEAGYNTEKNPVVFSLTRRISITDQQLGHLINIIDAEQYQTMIDNQGDVHSTATGKAIPITIEGITFENTLADGSQQGSAIYYHKQTKFNESIGEDGGKSDVLLDSAVSAVPKLTLRNCIFKNSGIEGANTPTVKIEEGGGQTLVVNSLFHHNNGNPLEAFNTIFLNSTSALNKGYLNIEDKDENGVEYHSSLHNSVVWKDDLNQTLLTDYPSLSSTHPIWSIRQSNGTELEVGTTDSITYNAYSLHGQEPDEANMVDAKQNVHISETNNLVLSGPNFANPDEGNFHLMPSKQLVNTGSNATYARIVWPHYYELGSIDYEALMHNIHVDQSMFDTLQTTIRVGDHDSTITYTIAKAHLDYDLGMASRLQSTVIDRGAYECLSSGQRIIYVDPTNATASDDATGRDWRVAYGSNKLQQAIDAASIYYNNNNKQAYVFVKGSTQPQGTIIVREGVDVYGSLSSTYTAWAVPINEELDEWDYTDAEVEAFVNRVKAERQGLASANNTPSYINGINTVGVLVHSRQAVIDGFVVAGDNETTATIPAVNIVVPNVTVRNCIVTGHTMANDQPVVNIAGRYGDSNKSLLYNTLVYNNTGQTIVNVGSTGNVLNSTIIAQNEGELPLGGTYASNPNNVQNTIAVNESAGRGSMFAPYLRLNANAYQPAAHLTSYMPYWYQLVETSNQINAGNDDGTTPRTGGNTIADNFSNVNFDLDRDLLGNPRRIDQQVDNGCFEAWKIDGTIHVTNITNGKQQGDEKKYVSDITADDFTYDPETAEEDEIHIKDSIRLIYDSLMNDVHAIVDKRAEGYWTQNYGGNFYPHAGSVVYVMQNANLVVDTDENEQPLFKTFVATPNPIRPGYVLLKTGGSIYGQGNALQFDYLAAEKTFNSGVQYGLISLPFDSHLDATSYSSITTNPFTAYTYDATSRAEYNYEFKIENSTLWHEYNLSNELLRTKGWLIKLQNPLENEETLRFTGWSTSPTLFVYEEEQNNEEKIITLTQNDNRPGDGTAHFTRQEDMGWNLIGLPYLVSEYRTDPQIAGRYNMHIPHIIYKMNTNGLYVKNSTAYAVRSWEEVENLQLNEGFFLQTATLTSSENLHFRRPEFSEVPISPAPRPLVMMRNLASEGDMLQVEPDENTDKQLDYLSGRDGIKWTMPDVPQLYLLSDKTNTRMSLAAQAPTETDLKLGVNIPNNFNTSTLFTFSLPNKEPFDKYQNIWLIDKAENHVTNLLETDYTTSVSQGNNNSRFLLRIGGMPLVKDGQREYIIFSYQHQLFIRGLIAGDEISVYSAAGQLILHTTANQTEFTAELPQTQGIYNVRVNDKSQKVVSL